MKTLQPLDDCFADGKLQTVEPSYEKACQSIALARAYLDEARQSGAIGTTRLAMNGLYFAWFHAGRSVLFRDGIREKSHYCLEQYLGTYVSAGRLDARWLSLFGRMRKKRESSQYSFSPAPLPDEIESVIKLTEEFIDRMEEIVSGR